jgi:hypothetical protein
MLVKQVARAALAAPLHEFWLHQLIRRDFRIKTFHFVRNCRILQFFFVFPAPLAIILSLCRVSALPFQRVLGQKWSARKALRNGISRSTF